MDNIFIERLWRSLKYEVAYLQELTDGFVAERFIDEWFNFYNTERPHSSFYGQTQAETYGATRPVGKWTTGCAGLDHFPTGITSSGIWHTARGYTTATRYDKQDFGNMIRQRNTP